MRLPRSLRTASFRLTALYVAIFAGSVAVLGGVVFLTVRRALDEQLTSRIEAETRFVQAEYRTGGLDRLLAAVRLRGRAVIALDYLVLDAQGHALAGELPPQPLPLGWTDAVVSEADDPPGTQDHERILVTDLGGGMRLWVADDTGNITAALAAIRRAFGVAIATLILLGTAGGLLLSRAYLASVDEITRTAEAISAGHLDRRVALRGTGDDFDQLAATLNRMLDRIGTLMESLRQVGSDVAHDLRTPLSQLRQILEEARTQACSIPDYEAAIEDAVGKTMELETIFSALLRIAQIENRSPALLFRDVDLGAVAERVADAFIPDAEEAGLTLAVAVAAPVVLRGDRELLTQMLVNLVENALRHSASGTRIHIGLTTDPGGARLIVEDDGPGIPPAERALVLNRFYRGERSRTTPGNGLGLSLVAAIVGLHGGTLALEDAQPGLRVVIRIPLAAGGASAPPRIGLLTS